MAKKIKESGIVLSKVVKPAIESFVSNGQVVPAMPERPTIVVACGEVDGENGITDMVTAKFVVDRATYDGFKFLEKVEVLYEYNGDGKIKPLEIKKVKGAKA